MTARPETIFYIVLAWSGLMVLGQGVISLLRRSKKAQINPDLPPDDHRFDLLWHFVPVAVLLLLIFADRIDRRKVVRTALAKPFSRAL